MAEITIEQLRTTIIDNDALAQDGFEEIRAIAKLALMALETPAGQNSPETLARAFEAIWGISERVEGAISSNAEEVGCNYVDSRFESRAKAMAEARHA
ncbi:hypothetical protein [Pandoraea terrigena]|uniref:Uncharacterized protein n=1 Tax=Pandoraea terrigena TaxID=2508292 RepID=A0A5E4URK2_9BURK|nr:hypothetical protein [Pandoraea terrigena]VVE01515.1 hypothetical protein PTE31013_02168 [Pandoraea terrigena]